MVGLAQSSSKYTASDAMDCSGLDREDNWGDDNKDIDIDAISKNHCARCDGYGHYAKDCPTQAGKAKCGKPTHVAVPDDDNWTCPYKVID